MVGGRLLVTDDLELCSWEGQDQKPGKLHPWESRVQGHRPRAEAPWKGGHLSLGPGERKPGLQLGCWPKFPLPAGLGKKPPYSENLF